jgi:hypothetical protein
VIFFVNGNEFIQPRHLEYNFIIQLVKENANNKVKDTLFFKLIINMFIDQSMSQNLLLKDGHDVT